MEFPPTYDIAEDAAFGEGIVFTDIHMDPNSIPAPAPAPFRAFNDNISDEEEEPIEEDPGEEDPIEEDPEEDPEEEEPVEENPVAADPATDEDATSGDRDDHMSEDEPAEAVPSFYTRRGSGSRVTRTARMSVRFSSTDYASSSRAPHRIRIPSHIPSPISSPMPSPPPSPAPSSPRSLSYSPTSLQPISPYVPPPSSPAAEPQPPSPPFPGNIPDASTPVLTLPPPPADTRMVRLIILTADFETRISQLEDTVRTSPGPAQFENLNQRVRDLEEQLNTAEQRAFEVRDRVMFRGGLEDRMQRLEARLLAVEVERDYFRSRTHHLEWMAYGRGRR